MQGGGVISGFQRVEAKFCSVRDSRIVILKLSITFNPLNNLVFKHKTKSRTAPKVFQNKLHKPIHKYPTNFSKSNCSIQSLCKKIPTNSDKIEESVTILKNFMRKKFLGLQNQISYC